MSGHKFGHTTCRIVLHAGTPGGSMAAPTTTLLGNDSASQSMIIDTLGQGVGTTDLEVQT